MNSVNEQYCQSVPDGSRYPDNTGATFVVLAHFCQIGQFFLFKVCTTISE